MNFKFGIILIVKERTLNKISQETLLHHYHYSGKKITSSKKPQKNQQFYKFTSGLTSNHWLDCSLAKPHNVKNINFRPIKVTQYQRMVTSIFLPTFDGNLKIFEVKCNLKFTDSLPWYGLHYI